MAAIERSSLTVHGVGVDVLCAGSGEPMVFLDTVDAESGGAEWLPIHEHLAQHHRLLVPIRPAPGSGGELTSAPEFAFFYRDVVDGLDVGRPHLVAVSAAGWFAAEMAVMCSDRFRSLTLVDAAGIRVSSEPPPDVFAMTLEQVRRLLFVDETLAAPPADGVDLAVRSRIRLMARVGWNPYLYDPKLSGRLVGIRVPTLVVWGGQDRLFTPSYAHAFASAIPHARTIILPGVGHLPSLERPSEVAQAITNFREAIAA